MHIISGSKDRDGTPQRYYACPDRCGKAAHKEDTEEHVLLVIMA
jgi:hypothetical protein